MKEILKIYLAGGMEGLPWEQQIGWRYQLAHDILSERKEFDIEPKFCDPTDYYNFEEPQHIAIREPMEFDLWKVKHSDLVIVNFTYKPVSLGTMAEITTAYNFGIPVLGLAEQGVGSLHDWQKSIPIRIFGNIYDLKSHVVEFYLS